MTSNNNASNFIYLTIFVIITITITIIATNSINKTIKKIDQTIFSLEGRIALQESKATLTAGSSCVIHEEGLQNPILARQLLEACLKAYEEKLTEYNHENTHY